jgi:acyl-CoA thioesterase-1
MRKPIRTKAKARGAARAIHYCLGLPCAWLLLLSLAACSSGDAESSPTSNPADPPEASSSEAPLAFEADRQARGAAQVPVQADQAATPVVVFLGTSLTAGYGLPENQAFPALIQERIDSSGLDYRVINAGVSGDTSAGGLRRLDWLLRLPIAAMVLELGANDMLRGQSISELRANLEAILDRTSLAHPDARFLIAGMRAAPNLGRDYVGEFDAVYPALASEYNAAFVPFLLEDVAAKRQLNQADGIHPTAAGHALIAQRLWRKLQPILH